MGQAGFYSHFLFILESGLPRRNTAMDYGVFWETECRPDGGWFCDVKYDLPSEDWLALLRTMEAKISARIYANVDICIYLSYQVAWRFHSIHSKEYV